MMAPQTELYDALFMASESLGFKTFQFLPKPDTVYPFVVMNSIQTLKVSLKTALQARFIVTIHFWGDEESWNEIIQMMELLNRTARKGFVTDSYRFTARVQDFDSQILVDDSVPNTMLNHGLLTLSFVLT